MAAAVAAGWGREATSVRHLPVGFGSHHWDVRTADGRRWFVTADDLEARGRAHPEPLVRLRAALATARALADAGLEFVVAPVATSAGTLRAALRDVRLRWDAGPLSDEARTLLAEHVADVLAALARHEAAAQRLRDSPGLLVVTHGEPDPGNTLSTAGRGAGGLKLRGPHRDTPDSRASLGYLRGVLQSLAALTP